MPTRLMINFKMQKFQKISIFSTFLFVAYFLCKDHKNNNNNNNNKVKQTKLPAKVKTRITYLFEIYEPKDFVKIKNELVHTIGLK